MAYLLGIDIGTSGTKTLLCDPAGRVLATATTEHDLQTPQPGWSEQDPRQWYAATQKATRAAVADASLSPHDITAIGLSGQMHGSVFLPADNHQPLRPALLWNDQRTAEQCREIETRAGGREKLIGMVGNPALTGFTAPKILWVRQHEPRVFEKTRHILLPKDYLRLRLTGEYATDVGDASGTLLLDVKHRAWHTGLIRTLDLDPDLLPPCFESHQVTGQLTAQAADDLGLRPGTPVVAGSGDQPAGAVGSGIVTGGIVSATLGTSGVVFAHSDQPAFDPHSRVHTMCAAVEKQWCVFGCILSAGGSLQWYRNQLAHAERDQAAAQNIDPYDILLDQAAHAAPGCEGLFFLPYLTGERCPHPDPTARGAWIGLTPRHGRPELVRSLIEGVTFGMADALRIIQGMNVAVDTVRLAGGGARSALWRQLQADVYDRPVALTNSDQGPAYGAAILAGVGTGVWASVPEACAAVIAETQRLEPNPHAAAFYRRRHHRYQRLYDALRPEFQAIAQLEA